VSVTSLDRGSRPSSATQTAPEFDRTPPQDLAAEQGVLGGMLLSKDALADVVETLKEADFYRPAHATIYEVATGLYAKGEPADTVSVAAELQRQGLLERIGGAAYLHTLIAMVPTAANAGYYARIVSEKAVRRRLVEAGMRVTQYGYNEAADVDDVVDRAQAEVFAVTESRTSDDFLPLEALMTPALEEIESIAGHDGSLSGAPTGFADLDALTNGLHPGQLIVLAARPGIGKSTAALDFARATSIKHGMASVVFSLEMSRIEITMRLLSAEARVHLQNMRNGRMSEDDWARLARRMGEIASAPLFIDDSPSLNMMELRAKCRRLKQKHDLKLVVLDYLQLMNPGKRLDSRQQEVSEMSRSLKLLAKELGVPVVALSQLNRQAETRADKKPQLSDLRESGAIEQDADMVILLHRDDAYEKESPRAGEADFIVAKHRNGPTDTVTVAFQGHYSRFVDMRRD
jgi:replicative DNA helicase